MLAGLVLCAHAGVLAAVSVFGGAVSNLGVALLGGFSVWFAGHAHGIVDEVIRRGKVSVAAERFIEMARLPVPDFSRWNVGADLAAGEAVAAMTVGISWAGSLPYIAMALLGAWFALRRGEM